MVNGNDPVALDSNVTIKDEWHSCKLGPGGDYAKYERGVKTNSLLLIQKLSKALFNVLDHEFAI